MSYNQINMTKKRPHEGHYRIIVAVTNDLVTDQRVHRACQTLHDEGYRVTLVGRRLRTSTTVQRNYTTQRMRLLFNKKAMFYAEYNFRLFLKLMFAHADAFYANDTDTLPATYLAARFRRKPMVFDAHEMFPEVPELVGRPAVKRIWVAIERHILPRLAKGRPKAVAITVCHSIAEHYKRLYGLAMEVVRNVPVQINVVDGEPSAIAEKLPRDKHILMYQGAVNIGRGIEWIVDAMPYLSNCHFVVAGVGDIYDRLTSYVQSRGLSDKVTFLGRIEPDELRKITPRASLGMSLLENRGLNYYYALPNRIADFVAASVPILATDFPEIHAVVSKHRIGTLVPAMPFDKAANKSQTPDPAELAKIISSALEYWERIDPDERRLRFEAAASDLSWENDKKTLINAVGTIF